MKNKKPLWYMEPEELTDLVDPNLKFIKPLGRSLARVNLVESEHGLSVLKIGTSFGEEYQDHTENGKKSLEVLSGVIGVPQFYDSYQKNLRSRGNYIAVLKEYIVGKEAPKELFFDDSFLNKMRELFREVGAKRVRFEFLGDIITQNIIMRYNQPHIIDWGFSEVTQNPVNQYQDWKTRMILSLPE